MKDMIDDGIGMGGADHTNFGGDRREKSTAVEIGVIKGILLGMW